MVLIGSELTIPIAEAEDSGKYTCLATNKAGVAEKDIRVDVLIRPKITNPHNSTELNAKLGDAISLQCSAKGHPAPKITWLKANNKLTTDGERLPKGMHLSINGQSLFIAKIKDVGVKLW